MAPRLGVLAGHRLAGPWLAARRVWRYAMVRRRAGFRILLLHDVALDRLGVLDRFVARIKRDHGFLTPDQAAARIGAPPTSPRAGRIPCLLSFDDGFASNYVAATRILDTQGVKALFFVCPELLDLAPEDQQARLAETVFDGRGGPDGGRLMTWDEIAMLHAAGHAIGAHGMTHQRLSALAGAPLAHEIVESGRRLGRRLDSPVPWFAYPFGDVASISAAALALIGAEYRFCRSGVRGVNGTETHPWALRADHIDLDAPDAYRALVIDGGLDFRYRDARRRLDAMVQAPHAISDPGAAD